MSLRRGIALLLASGLGLFVGCLGDGTGSNCQPGTAFCQCLSGVVCQVGLECVGGICIGTDPDSGETFASLGTLGDGDGDGDTTSGDGDGGPGDGDGGPGDGDGDGDGSPGDGDGGPNCPPGQFGCPCDQGVCDPGLSCINGTCQLGGGDGDGDGDGDPWDPNTCDPPSQPVSVQDIPGSFCSAPCVDNSDCPPSPPGTQGQCVLNDGINPDPSLCALVCVPAQDTCPPPSSCEPIPNQPDAGLCTY